MWLVFSCWISHKWADPSSSPFSLVKVVNYIHMQCFYHLRESSLRLWFQSKLELRFPVPARVCRVPVQNTKMIHHKLVSNISALLFLYLFFFFLVAVVKNRFIFISGNRNQHQADTRTCPVRLISVHRTSLLPPPPFLGEGGRERESWNEIKT